MVMATLHDITASMMKQSLENLFGALDMEKKKEIVFFEDLGFGWQFDAAPIQKIREKESIEEILIQRSLAELLRKGRLI
jgi:hypothetical protein